MPVWWEPELTGLVHAWAGGASWSDMIANTYDYDVAEFDAFELPATGTYTLSETTETRAFVSTLTWTSDLLRIELSVPFIDQDSPYLRFVGAELDRGDLTVVASIYRQARGLTLTLSILVSGLVAAAAEPIAQAVLNDPTQAVIVRLLGLLVVPCALLGIHAAMLKALGRPAWGGFFEAGAWPSLTLIGSGNGKSRSTHSCACWRVWKSFSSSV